MIGGLLVGQWILVGVIKFHKVHGLNGLKHHVLSRRICNDQLKVDIEKLVKSITWRRKKLKNESAEKEEKNEIEVSLLTSDINDEIKGLVRNFTNYAKRVVDSSLNQGLYKHLTSLTSNKSIAVTNYDKGNGVCILDKEDYLTKLDIIVNDYKI